MIKRNLYIEKIRPFMNQNIVKVITGIRRSGKSVMLELIKEELSEHKDRFISANFESKSVNFVRSADETYKGLD